MFHYLIEKEDYEDDDKIEVENNLVLENNENILKRYKKKIYNKNLKGVRREKTNFFDKVDEVVNVNLRGNRKRKRL